MCPLLCRWQSPPWMRFWNTSLKRQSTGFTPSWHLSPTTLSSVSGTLLWEDFSDKYTTPNGVYLCSTDMSPVPKCVSISSAILKTVPKAQVAPMLRSETKEELPPPPTNQDGGDYVMPDDHDPDLKPGENEWILYILNNSWSQIVKVMSLWPPIRPFLVNETSQEWFEFLLNAVRLKDELLRIFWSKVKITLTSKTHFWP